MSAGLFAVVQRKRKTSIQGAQLIGSMGEGTHS